MEKSPHSQSYRVGAILVVDLVKYSGRTQEIKDAVQRILEKVFFEAKMSLCLTDAQFSYTGDGYFCAFLGDSSAAVLEFINLAWPEMKRLLAEHQQQFRAGLDFGLVRQKQNTLTGSVELSGFPGIIATRLEEGAEPNTILCSETVHQIFFHSFPEMFSEKSRIIETKDRKLRTYNVQARDLDFLSNMFLRLVWPFQRPDAGIKVHLHRRIMIVDDESWLLEMCAQALHQRFPTFEIVSAKNGDEALAKYREGGWDVVLADINMDGMDGYALTENILRVNPEQKVIIMTGLCDLAGMRHAYTIGAIGYIPKPFTIELLYETFDEVIATACKRSDREKLAALSDDPGEMFTRIHLCKELFRSIRELTGRSSDLASSMLRHKAKQIVRDFAAGMRPGMDILSALSRINVQLTSLERLARSSKSFALGQLRTFLESFYSDLGESHSKIKFQLIWKNFQSDALRGLPETVILLIISELIDNAIFALDNCGTIETTISYLKSSNSLRIVVQDSGPGIPNDLREKVFTEGVSSKGEGRGLGLWLIREAVRTIKGEVSYQFNKGAEFCIRIPIDQIPAS